MKNFIFFLLASLLSSGLYAQRGFYSKDSIKFSGIKVIDGGNLKFKVCQIQKGTKKIQFSPQQIDSYGFNNRQTYKAFTLDVNGRQEKYFLQLLVSGKENLYFAIVEGERKYFLNSTSNSELKVIPQLLTQRANFLDSILADCSPAIQNIPKVRFRSNDLIRFIRDYNICADRPLLRPRWGVELGATSYNMSSVGDRRIYPVPASIHSFGFSIGAFADLPISTVNFSFHPELNLEHFSKAESFTHDQDYDLVLNSSAVAIPFYLRYTVLKKVLSPFFQLGPVFSQSIQNNQTLYQYRTIGSEVFVALIDSQVLQESMAGFSIGSGIISNYGSRYSWFAEANLSKMQNLKSNTNLYNRYEVAFKIGILF